MRRLGSRDPEAMVRIAQALGVWDAATRRPQRRSASRTGSTRLSARSACRRGSRSSSIDRAVFPQLIEHSLRNFNADPKREFVREPEMLMQVLDAAW